MPSRRMISPAFWRSESMAQLTKEQRLLFIGLISNADDQGRLRAHPSLIRSDVFPFEDESLDKIKADLEAIAATDSILIYSANSKQYLQIINWWTYQKPKWAWPSEKPAPEGWADRLHYRVGNESVKQNWDGSEAAGESKLGESETIVEPERGQNETIANSAPSTRTSNSDSASINDSNSVNESEDPPTAGADAPPPPPSKRPQAKGKKKTPTPEAVRVFRENAHRYPPKAWYNKIAEVVGDNPADLEFWGQVVFAYVGQGWNPTNIANMLEFYGRREIPATGGRGKNVDEPAGFEGIRKWGRQHGILEGPR